MIQIHQAIYGDLDSGYYLLDSSFPSSEIDIPTRLAGKTDLIDRPPGTILSAPIFRGILTEDYFLFVKSFPDNAPGVRRGRIFSHVLFLEESDYLKVKDITILLDYFLELPDRSVKLTPIVLQETFIADSPAVISGQIAGAINGIIQHIDFQNTILWIGETGYFDFIGRLWPALPKAIKLKIQLGVAFNPSKINTEYLNLKYLPAEFKSNWSRTSFKLVDSSCNEGLQSKAAYLLAGDQEKSKELRGLVNDFSLKIEEIDDLKTLETLLPTYASLPKGNNLKSLLEFVHLISYYNPHKRSAAKAKSRILHTILGKCLQAKAEEIKIIGSPDWSGIAKAKEALTDGLNEWLDENLLHEKPSKSILPLLDETFTHNPKHWWSKAISARVSYLINEWQPSFSNSIWFWWKQSPALIGKIGNVLPNKAEAALVSSFPSNIQKPLANSLCKLAISKKWLYLHGLSAIKLYEPKEALTKQLSYDIDKTHFDVLEAMAEHISEESFIKATVDLNSTRLFSIGGKLCLRKPKLLSSLKVEKTGWQEIWLEAVCQGTPLWEGIKKPEKTLFQVMDLLIEGEAFNADLLDEISKTSSANLIAYPKRQQVWDILPIKSRDRFLQTTAISCMQSLLKDDFPLNNLERPLKEHIQSPLFVRKLLRNKNISVLSKLKFIEEIPGFNEKEIIDLIDNNTFSKIESSLLGQKIKDYQWRRVANHCYDLYFKHRSDLKFTLEKCIEFFNAFKKIGLSIRGFNAKTISTDDCWTALLRKAAQLYPYGPDQNGVWERAGGSNENLHSSGAGKERWQRALRHVRYGGQPNQKTLISTMLREYPKDQILNFLLQRL